jgi:hypothetical protein
VLATQTSIERDSVEALHNPALEDVLVGNIIRRGRVDFRIRHQLEELIVHVEPFLLRCRKAATKGAFFGSSTIQFIDELCFVFVGIFLLMLSHLWR